MPERSALVVVDDVSRYPGDKPDHLLLIAHLTFAERLQNRAQRLLDEILREVRIAGTRERHGADARRKVLEDPPLGLEIARRDAAQERGPVRDVRRFEHVGPRYQWLTDDHTPSAKGKDESDGGSLGSIRLCTLTPTKRTGRWPASVRASNAQARAASASASRVAGNSLWLRVMVVKSEYRTLIVTVRHSNALRSSHCASPRAISSTAARMSARLVRSSVNVFSLPHDFAARFGTTGRSSTPSASRRSQSIWLPTASRRVPSSADRTSIRRLMPLSRRRVAVTGPTPHRASTGSRCRNSSTRSGGMTVKPSGFFHADAIFARNLFGATPADAVRPVVSRICAFRRWATTRPRPSPQAFWV